VFFLDNESNILTKDDLKFENHKFSIFSENYIFLCSRKLFLDRKILIFFFHIIFLSFQNFEFLEFKFLKGSKFISRYKIILKFLRYVYYVMNLVNNDFRMNSERFFSDKKDLIEFIIYYKLILFHLFLSKTSKFSCYLTKFSFNFFFNYFVYSIYYFLKRYIVNIRNLELKKKTEKGFVYLIPKLTNSVKSYLYYKTLVYNYSKHISEIKEINIPKMEIPLYLFCSNRVNFNTLSDKEFTFLLHDIRVLFRIIKRKKNSFDLLEKIIKKYIPLSKIVYQRRGRNIIPLMTFIYTERTRISLVLKQIFKDSNYIQGNCYAKKLLTLLVNILLSNTKDDFVYQSDKNSDTRKEAYNRGYFLKTLKATVKKIKK